MLGDCPVCLLIKNENYSYQNVWNIEDFRWWTKEDKRQCLNGILTKLTFYCQVAT